MQIRPSLFVAHSSATLFLVPASPPDFHTPPEAPDGREIDGEDEQAERNHPESENGEKAQEAAEDEGDAKGDAHRARRRNRQGEASEIEPGLAGRRSAVRIGQFVGPGGRVSYSYRVAPALDSQVVHSAVAQW